MGKYCSVDSVKKRLESKVKFNGPGETDPNKMGTDLLNSLISEAESQLEIDLMMRYDVPFKSISDSTFENLPDVSRISIRNLAELISVVRVLETDFGRGTSANADKYTEMLQKRYDKVVAQLMERREVNGLKTLEWLLPPLPGLASAYCNQGDSGFRGRAHHTNTVTHQADFATHQINSPAENIFNGVWDPVDHGNVRGG